MSLVDHWTCESEPPAIITMDSSNFDQIISKKPKSSICRHLNNKPFISHGKILTRKGFDGRRTNCSPVGRSPSTRSHQSVHDFVADPEEVDVLLNSLC